MKLMSSFPAGESDLLLSFIQNDLGATAIGYGLLAALISVVIIGAMTALGTNLNTPRWCGITLMRMTGC